MGQFKHKIGTLVVSMLVVVWSAFSSIEQQKPEQKFKLSAIDMIQNIYIIGNQNSIYKYQNGALKFSQNFKIYGNIYSVDVSNPLELYIFYKESNNILFLDNTLALRGSVDLSKTSIGLATAMCRSYDNGIWLFDQTDLQVKKMNKAGEVLQTSGNPIAITNKQLNPTYMVEDGNLLYMSDTTIGIIITDLNANYQRTIPIKGIKQFYIDKQRMFFCLNSDIYMIDLKLTNQTMVKTMKERFTFNSFISNQSVVIPSIDSTYSLIHF
ncbi:MAG: hypothetical protein HYZ42_01195 [Bacteroidetes bacterium]|nr:hypothetical protein [Bacteroidota bacterium]